MTPDCRSLAFWEQDETVQQLREAAQATGLTAHVQALLEAPGQPNEHLLAIAEILDVEGE